MFGRNKKKKKKSKLGLWKFFLVPVVLAALWYGIFSIPGFQTNPYSPRYVGWKLGVLPYPEGTIHATLGLDPKRDQLVQGLGLEELKERFPDAHSAPKTDRQERAESELGGAQHLWLGSSELVIILDGGKGKEIRATES